MGDPAPHQAGRRRGRRRGWRCRGGRAPGRRRAVLSPERAGAPAGAAFAPAELTEEERAAAIERGRLLFAGEARFFFAAQRLDQLPAPDLPEVAFAGRSNVGKSSLINALTGHRALARASSEPGRTKQLNFFALAGRMTLVDMPGYGYAKANRQVKEDWQGLMFDFLRGRPTLRRVALLLDSRIEIKPNDLDAMALLNRAAVIFQLVLTKCDAPKPAALLAKQDEVRALAGRYAAAHPTVLCTSSGTGEGIAALRASLAELAGPGPVQS